jgi:hypothetical protein
MRRFAIPNAAKRKADAVKPVTKRPSFLILTIKEDGEQIVLRDRDGNDIAAIVARPHRGRVKVGVSAGTDIVITREAKP